jgi:hypothetical protein
MDIKRLRKGMKKINFKNLGLIFTIALLSGGVLLGCTGCGNDDSAKVTINHAPGEPIEDSKDEKKDSNVSLLMIRELDMSSETITLQSLATGDVIKYKYSLTTRFLDSHGDVSSWNNFYPGRVVTIGNKLKDENISKVQLSGKVWEQDDVVKYNVDTELNMLTIGKSKYHMKADVPVFSNGQVANIADVGESDTLRVVGKDKDIISVSITTGHGTVELVNTDLFNGTLMEIGTKIFSVISGEGMKIDVPEGKYQLTVANDDGYGGTSEIEVKRGETTVCDLNNWKGEGPKLCNIVFHVGVDGALIYLDNKPVEKDTAMQVVYGRHSLKVQADGYDDFSKTLVVNSATAEITLDLSDEKTNSGNSTNSGTGNSTTTNNSTTNNSANSNTNSSNGTSSSNQTNSNSTNKSTTGTNNGTSYGATGTGQNTSKSTSNSSKNSTTNSSDTTGTDYLTTMSEALSSLFKTGD